MDTEAVSQGAIDYAMPSDATNGYVYLIRCYSSSESFYKIGWSASPSARFHSLRTANPFPMELVAVVEGSRNDEAHFHYRYRHRHVGGEWFALTEDDLAEMFEGHDQIGTANFMTDLPEAGFKGLRRPTLAEQGAEMRRRDVRPRGGGPKFKATSGLNAEILRCIAQREADGEGAWLSAICADLTRNIGSVRPQIVRLLGHGYLEAEEHPDRRVLYRLTDQARAVLAQIGVRPGSRPAAPRSGRNPARGT